MTLKHCPICNESGFNFIYNAHPLDYSVATEYKIYKCYNCGYGATEINQQAVSDMAALYNTGNYNASESLIHKIVRPFLNIIEKVKAKKVKNISAGNRLLEVGCGKGHFLKAAKQQGMDVNGIEPSNRSRKYANSLLGGNVVYSDRLDEFSKKVEIKYDVVYLWHVFEHLDDLPGSIKAIEKLISDDGVLIMAVPNFSSIQAKIGRSQWYHLDPPRHIHHFTPLSIRALLNKHDFTNINIHYDSYFQDFMGAFVTYGNKVNLIKNLPINLLKKNQHVLHQVKSSKGLFSIIMYFLFLPITLTFAIADTVVSRLTKRTGTMIIYASKN